MKLYQRYLKWALVIGLALPTSAVYADIEDIIDNSAGQIEPVLIPAQAQLYYYHGIRYETYPSHVIVSRGYDRPSVQNMVTFSNELGWDTFYVQSPERFRVYSTQYVIEDDTTCGRQDCSALCGRKGCGPGAQKLYSSNCEAIDCSIPCDTGCSTCFR